MMKFYEGAFISERAGISIVDFLADEVELSKAKLKDVMQKGGVWLKRGEDQPARIRKSKTQVKLGDEIHLYYDAEYLAMRRPALELVSDQDAYSVWHKPFGISHEVSLFSDHLTFERALDQDVPHDRDCYWVSSFSAYHAGLFIIAHTRSLAAQFEQLMGMSGFKAEYEIDLPNAEQILEEYFAEEPNILSKTAEIMCFESALLEDFDVLGDAVAEGDDLTPCYIRQITFDCPVHKKTCQYRSK